MAVERRLYTVEEFEQYADAPENAHRLLELIDGEIREKMPTEQHGLIAVIIAAALALFAHPRKLGRVTSETRYRKPGEKRNARIPDVSFSSAKRPIVEKGSVPEYPDLAVEIQSPVDSLKEMREEARFYLANGSRLVWLVIPEKRLIEVYTADVEDVLTENDTLTGGDVLTGFALPVRDVFADPME
jgi:Uma2 family endonuclease